MASSTTSFPSSLLLSLQPELRRRISFFLCPKDVLQLSLSCRALRRQGLSLSLLRAPINCLLKLDENRQGEDPVFWMTLPVKTRHRPVHSMHFSFSWHDQGWGNHKGRLWICKRLQTSPRPELMIWDNVICETHAVAPEVEKEGSLTFTVLEDESSLSSSSAVSSTEYCYDVYYRVGGGGGHELHVKNGRLSAIVYDDEDRSWKHQHNTLSSLGALQFGSPKQPLQPFYPQLLLQVSHHLLIKLREKDIKESATMEVHPLSAHLQAAGLRLDTEASLQAIEAVLQDAMLEHEAMVRIVEEKEESRRQRRTQRPNRFRHDATEELIEREVFRPFLAGLRAMGVGAPDAQQDDPVDFFMNVGREVANDNEVDNVGRGVAQAVQLVLDDEMELDMPGLTGRRRAHYTG